MVLEMLWDVKSKRAANTEYLFCHHNQAPHDTVPQNAAEYASLRLCSPVSRSFGQGIPKAHHQGTS